MAIWIPGVDDIQADIDQYQDAAHDRKPDGYIFVNGQEVATTHQCPHCGGHYWMRKGSGHQRHFCLKCMSACCDQAFCHPEHYHGVLGKKHWTED